MITRAAAVLGWSLLGACIGSAVLVAIAESDTLTSIRGVVRSLTTALKLGVGVGLLWSPFVYFCTLKCSLPRAFLLALGVVLPVIVLVTPIQPAMAFMLSQPALVFCLLTCASPPRWLAERPRALPLRAE